MLKARPLTELLESRSYLSSYVGSDSNLLAGVGAPTQNISIAPAKPQLVTAAATPAPYEPVINTPQTGTLFSGGQSMSYTGSARNSQGQLLAAADVSWSISLVETINGVRYSYAFHNATGFSGTFAVPRQWEGGALNGRRLTKDAYVSVTFSAKDGAGVVRSTTNTLFPNVQQLKVAPNVPGLIVYVNEAWTTSPYEDFHVAGAAQMIKATEQRMEGKLYEFRQWVDAAGQPLVSRDDGSIYFNMPASPTTYTAIFEEVPLRAPDIYTPQTGDLFSGGQVIEFSGTAYNNLNNPVYYGDNLYAIDLMESGGHSYQIYLYSGDTGSFQVPRVWPDTGEPISQNTNITVTLSGDSSSNLTTTHTLFPNVQQLKLATSVPGLKLGFDSVTPTSSFDQFQVAGTTHSLIAQPLQELNGKTYQFVRWSDGGNATHTFNMPSVATTYTAIYREVSVVNGLRGTYYNNVDFTGTSITRRDASINFNWSTGSPIAPLDADSNSVRWTGQVRADKNETYTFSITSDDGARLWVDNKLIVDQWTSHTAREYSGSIKMTAGKKVDIRLEYFDGTGAASAVLRWSSPTTAKAIIPTANLFSTTTLTPVSLTSSDIGAVTPAGSTSELTPGKAYDISGGGADINGTSDRFRFAQRLVNGDFDVAVRVGDLTALDSGAKGGLMVRDGTGAGARNIFVGVTKAGQTFVSSRSATNGTTARVTSSTQTPPNSWIRLRRVGDTFTTFRSTDGMTWTQINQLVIDFQDTANVGLAVTSGNASRTAQFRFRDFN